MNPYRLLDHTADLGIQVYGEGARQLFENAAGALIDRITDPGSVAGDAQETVALEGEDWPDLMVNWLREVLYFWTGRERVPKGATVHTISAYRLSATVRFDPYEPKRHVIRQEIKAVTYHQIDVRRESTRWTAKIIFDV